MEEVRIDIKKTSKRNWPLIIGFILFFGSFILILIGLIFWSMGWVIGGAIIWWWGTVPILFEMSELRKVPLNVFLTDEEIRFKHFLGISKYPKHVKWTEIKEIWPSNYIELNNGKKIVISYMDSGEFDLLMNHLVDLNLTHLLKGNVGRRMNVKKEGPKPDVSYTASGKERDLRIFWVPSLILLIPLTLGAFFIGYIFLIAGIWIGAVAFLFIALLMGIAVVIAIIFVQRPPRDLRVKVSPEGIFVDEKGKTSQQIGWGEIDRIENTLDSLADFVLINLHIYKKNGDSVSFTDHVIKSKEHGELFKTMSKYCFYYGIPIVDNVGYLRRELASSKRLS